MNPARFRMLPSLLCLLLALPIIALARPAADPEWQPTGKLLASDGDAGHWFGSGIGLWGSTALVGTAEWNEQFGQHTGAVYVYQHTAAGWAERAQLLPDGTDRTPSFGSKIVLHGDVAFIAASNSDRSVYGQPDWVLDAGAVYIFTGQGSNWTRTDKLMAPQPVANGGFGSSLALDGNTLAVGAPEGIKYAHEAVYVFTGSGSQWGNAIPLTGPDQNADHNFGTTVALAGDVLLVGAPGINCCGEFSPFQKGIVHIFTRNNGVWTRTGALQPTDGYAGDLFGCRMAYNGQIAVIGTCQAYGLPNPRPSAAYVFTRSGAAWGQTARLEPSTNAIVLSSDQIVTGADDLPPNENQGRIVFFERVGNSWAETSSLSQPDDQVGIGFGSVVALNDWHLLAGAFGYTHDDNEAQGTVYTFKSTHVFAESFYVPIVVGP